MGEATVRRSVTGTPGDGGTGVPNPEPDSRESRIASLTDAEFNIAMSSDDADLNALDGFVTRVDPGVTSYTVTFTPMEEGATLWARLNGQTLEPTAGTTFTVPVTAGATVLELWVTAPDGEMQRIYRWVTLSMAEAADPAVPPVINEIGEQLMDLNEPVTLADTLADPGEAVTWSATNLPAGLTIDAATGEITGTPTAAGIHDVSVRATDAQGMVGGASLPRHRR